jgi:glycolate oxidase iron-sulfur subunit
VHCGFCTATCPTYQLLGDELDSPRGRIYLIKQLLEGHQPTRRTQLHLDRCLSCRSCETTCPSGVAYGRLADIGRHLIEQQVDRDLSAKIQRRALRTVVPYPGRFSVMLSLGRLISPLLPSALKKKIPPLQPPTAWPTPQGGRRLLVLEGCAQKALTPNTNAAAARLLQRLGFELVREPQAGCCGAVSYHLCAEEEALNAMRRNIDAWWPHIARGDIEAILITASGCGSMLKEYGYALKADPAYAEKAERVAALSKDLCEILAEAPLKRLNIKAKGRTIAYHSPCSLQHGQKLGGVVEKILTELGFALTPVADAHLCCGSAGTYSLLQPELSQQLLSNKLDNLQAGQAELIATANVGCQLHLQTQSRLPVQHWVELLDECTQG